MPRFFFAAVDALRNPFNHDFFSRDSSPIKVVIESNVHLCDCQQASHCPEQIENQSNNLFKLQSVYSSLKYYTCITDGPVVSIRDGSDFDEQWQGTKKTMEENGKEKELKKGSLGFTEVRLTGY